jgi:Bardet-Biedl syndrome 5 protein
MPCPQISEQEEDVEIVDAADRGDVLATYYADATKAEDRDHVYNAELGLAVEQLKEGVTVEQLWSVL